MKHTGWQVISLGIVSAAALVVASPRARACGGGGLPSPIALPAPATTGVSTATSIIVLWYPGLSGLSLVAAGQAVPVSTPIQLGAGARDGFPGVTYLQIRPLTLDGLLVPSSEHVLTAQVSGQTVELTRFTTGAGYDKLPGTPPVVRGLRLWRVRYPLSEISSGDCVGAEYHGFLTVDYDPATVPNTPPSSVVHTFQLSPKTGGNAQTFIYSGATPFTGLEPVGDHPLPLGLWSVELDPTREYCLTISAFGEGDIARPMLANQSVCASVVPLSSAGAPPSPTIGIGGAAGSSAGGAGGQLVADDHGVVASGGCAIAGDTNRASTGLLAAFAFSVSGMLARARRRRVR